MTETTPLSGKKTWSSGLSASTRICSRRQGTCSRCDISRLRSREGKASKSRLRGNLDKPFILSTRSRICAGSKRGASLQLQSLTFLSQQSLRHCPRAKRVGGREPAEVGHGLQVPDDDARLHACRHRFIITIFNAHCHDPNR